MTNDTFVPAPGEISIHNASDIKVGNVIGYIRNGASQGRIGIVDHKYKNASGLTYYVIRHVDDTSESVSSARFYDVDKTNRKLLALMDHNERTMLTLRHSAAAKE